MIISLIKLTNFIAKNKITSAERNIANVIINFSSSITTKKIKDVVEKAYVTHSTVSKFIKKIGYASWNDFLISVLFEEKVKASHYDHQINDKVNLEIENVKLFLRTKAQKQIQTIVNMFTIKNRNFIFYGKGLTGNVAQYLTWNFTSNGLFGTHTYFLDELKGILTQKSILVAFCLEEINNDFLEAISFSKIYGTKVISIIVGQNKQVSTISHLSLQIPSTGYFSNDVYYNIIQNEILRFVGLQLFEIWHQRTKIPKN